ncbi:unnamed protein product [Brachionus calyciflorus]|uniref:Reverse transcriptase domain-containing protein n=1 Tax=Brachionus calyciflorus TaxID=104777 RepID=A0A813TXL8_9BILA|nr:unnamed protein product [Brachionus calyciflorus]
MNRQQQLLANNAPSVGFDFETCELFYVQISNDFSYSIKLGLEKERVFVQSYLNGFQIILIILVLELKIGFQIGLFFLNNILYADDIVLIANNSQELNQLLKFTEEYGIKHELKFNPNKTNYMIMFSKQLKQNGEDEKIIFQNEDVKRVIMMKYLGIWVDETFNNRSHFDCRTKLFTLEYFNLKKCGITSDILNTDIKLCFYKTAINIDKLEEKKCKTKLRFLIKLCEFDLTRNLIQAFESDENICMDSKSLFNEILKLTWLKIITELIYSSKSILENLELKRKDESKDDLVYNVKPCLEHTGDQRRGGLKQLLKITY